MLTRRFVLTGLIAAPAVIAADKLMPVHSLPERYATVWGVGHNLEVVEHVIWEPISIMAFGMSDDIDKFREITTWEWGFPVEPMPTVYKNPRKGYAIDPLARFDKPVDDNRGVTNITTTSQQNAWRESLRPDLGSHYSKEWAEEVMRLNELNGYDKYHDVYWKWWPEHLGS